MSALPNYVTVLLANRSSSFDPSVQRTDMERGPAKQSIKNSQVLRTINASLLFRSRADALAFEAWYFDVIKRIGWFNFTDSQTQESLTVRFRGGSIGSLVPANPSWALAQRDVVMEHYQ